MLYILCLCTMGCVAGNTYNRNIADIIDYNFDDNVAYPYFERITTKNGLSNNSIQFILPMPEGRMAAISWRYINIFDGRTVSIFPRDDQATVRIPNHRYNYEAYIDNEENIWVKEYALLWCFDTKKGIIRDDILSILCRLSGLDNLEPTDLKDVYFDKSGIKFILTDNGLWSTDYKERIETRVNPENVANVQILDDNSIIVFDIFGNADLITGKNSAHYIECEHSDNKNTKPSTYKVIRSGNIFYRLIGYGKFCKIDKLNSTSKSWEPIAETDMIIHSIHVTNDDILLATTRHGLLEFSPDSCFINIGVKESLSKGVESKLPVKYFMNFHTIDGNMDDISLSCISNDWQNGLWIATNNNGILYAHTSRYKIKSGIKYADIGLSESDSLLCRQRYRKVYNGLYQNNNDSITDRHGRVWTASHIGIDIKSDEKNTFLSSDDGLLSDYVISLTEDGKGRVWAITNEGINCITDSGDSMEISSFGYEHGMPDWDMFRSSSLLLNDGSIAAQSSQGWIKFHPDSLLSECCTLRPRLAAIYVNGHKLSHEINQDGLHLPMSAHYISALTLDYKHNNVKLVFTTPEYIFPKNIDYQWKILNSSKDTAQWNSGKANIDPNGCLSLNFVELQPDDYKILVKTRDKNIFEFNLTISPPWWRTWYAYLLYLLISAGIIYCAIKYYLRHRQNQMEQEQKEALLIMRIHNLMELIESVADETISTETKIPKNDDTPTPADHNPTPDADSEFVQKAINLVEKHLHDTYTVEQLSSDMCMERTGLYKRMTSIINRSPQAFIRSIKLNHASKMLRDGMSATEVSSRLGFSSLSHFSRCFSNEFGVSPSEFVKKNTDNEPKHPQ